MDKHIGQAEAFGRIVGLLASLKDDPTIHRLGANRLLWHIWTIAGAPTSEDASKCEAYVRAEVARIDKGV